MIRYSIPVTFLYYFIISLALFKFSQNKDFLLNWVNVLSFYLVSNMSDTIWQLVVTAWHNLSFISSKIGLFHLMVYLFSPSLEYVISTGIMSHGLNQILNHFVVFNVYITVKICQYLLGRHRSSTYSNNSKTTSLHHLFSSDMIVQIRPF